jgi:tetratricopeptide (TPR) repeat protein
MGQIKRDQLPVYTKGIEAYLAGDLRRLERLMSARQLGYSEKRLLAARLALRRRELAVATRLLEGVLATDQKAFFLGEGHMLFATVQTMLGHFEQSAAHNQKAFEFYRECDDRRGQFLSSYNLAVDLNRMGLCVLSNAKLELSGRLAVEAGERSLVLRLKCCNLSRIGLVDEALRVLDEALTLAGQLSKLDFESLLSISIDLYARGEKFDRALEVVASLEQSKLFRESAKLGFERAWLEFLSLPKAERPSFPRRPSRIEDSGEYSLKWSLLQNLASGDRRAALNDWAELKQMFTSLMGEPFEFLAVGEPLSLFGRALDLWVNQRAIVSPQKNAVVTGHEIDLLARLDSLLRSSQTPLRKAELVERIWGQRYEPSFDHRFHKLMSRLKATGAQLVFKNKAYSLIQSGEARSN